MKFHLSLMRRVAAILGLATLLLFFHTNTKAGNLGKQDQQNQTMRSLVSMPLSFTKNEGQWDSRVAFRVDAGGVTMWYTADGAYYQFTRPIATDNRTPDFANQDSIRSSIARQQEPFESMMIKASFVGANLNPQITGVDLLTYKTNYFIGNVQSNWVTDVPNYTAVVYRDIYQGVDLKYYGNGAQLEYDFIVAPGADFSQIKIHYAGAESVSVNSDGELVVTTQWGEVIEQRPVIYQVENNNRIAVEGKYLIQGDKTFGFELSQYDRALPLVIDPVLTYSSYLGGSNPDYGVDIDVDASGATYVVGRTVSTDFPTFNPFQVTHQGGFFDVFVTKLSSSGASLIYSAYLGGSGSDGGHGIAVDSVGNVYITGITSSTDFPTTNPYQATKNGNSGDAFVVKLSSAGSSIIYSTYLGGSNLEQYLLSGNIAVDASGSAYITGFTLSTDFPTLNAFQGTYPGGDWSAFVTKLSPSGSSLDYSTYLGGSGGDIGYGIAVDATGMACITGDTESADFPTHNAFQGSFQGGLYDAFVTKLSASGSNLVYSSFLGGGSFDHGIGVAVDTSGAAYVVGSTRSSDFPILNPYQGTSRGSDEVFVTKVSSSGANLIYSTYIGGTDQDFGNSIAVDAFGLAYITGKTRSADFPTLNPHQSLYQGGASDAFVSKLSASGGILIYSSYLGGSAEDFAFSIAIDDSGSSYVTGHTYSADFPILSGVQETLQGPKDAYVVKFSQPPCCAIAGDFDSDGSFNVADVSFAIARIFSAGPAPSCQDQADTNGDGAFNIADVTYGVARIFSDGPSPICGQTGA